jgi:hypothetical protein
MMSLGVDVERHDSFFIIHFLDNAEKAASQQTNHDLHVTFLPQIITNDPGASEKLADILQKVAQRSSAFYLLPNGETDRFGTVGEYEVRLFDPSDEAQAVHFDLVTLASAEYLNVVNPQYSRSGFTPHMSLTDASAALQPPSALLVNSLTLVRHIGGLGGAVEFVHTVVLD